MTGQSHFIQSVSQWGKPVKTSTQIRQEFLDFFAERGHTVVPSASLVPMGDPTLLFTNAGMNQFKDMFLGTGQRSYNRAADTQKCLRVSGKHNDLDEVGHDTYHHTLFEMLGNWSFGDYFKKEAICWAWELLVDQWGLDPDRLYATVHEGDKERGLDPDKESAQLWQQETTLHPDHILYCGSKDNFWMMGETGPCGPCTEIHVDLRSDEERAKIPGKEIVNADHPEVIEVWNLVFIQYNAQADGSLRPLAAKHVDTGMGFERITAVIQGVSSTYDTDLFAPILQKTADLSPLNHVRGYEDIETDNEKEREQIRIAMRVIADHIRTIAFATADNAAPSNTGRGYVIRRILRRAVRYGYQFLELRKPFLYELVDVLCTKMGEHFPELLKYQRSIEKIVESEEKSFLQTLASGLQLFGQVIPYVERLSQADDATVKSIKKELSEDHQTIDLLGKAFRDISKEEMLSSFVQTAQKGKLSGNVVFLLHDTFGFPSDLTEVMCREYNLSMDDVEFENEMKKQKERARSAASFKVDHSQNETWNWLSNSREQTIFRGYTESSLNDIRIQATRILEGEKGQKQHQIVLEQTPFYAESGGQKGDTGILQVGNETVQVLDTLKEDGYFIHIVEKLPKELDAPVTAKVDVDRRLRIAKHHTATHLLHAALREVLGPHVQQQGSLVAPDRLRFDFSHFERVTPAQLREIETIANRQIQANIAKREELDVPIEEAIARGATALFGEKYGEAVRIITFDPDYSMELCGGIHVDASGQLGLIRLMSESAVASGVRRIEAITGYDATHFIQQELASLDQIRHHINSHPDRTIEEEVAQLIQQSKQLEKELSQVRQKALQAQLKELLQQAEEVGPAKLVVGRFDGIDSGTLRQLAQDLSDTMPESTVAVLGSASPEDGKVYLAAAVSKDLIKSHNVKAGNIVGTLAKMVGGGGGGRPNLATAGGRNPEKLDEALAHASQLLSETVSV